MGLVVVGIVVQALGVLAVMVPSVAAGQAAEVVIHHQQQALVAGVVVV